VGRISVRKQLRYVKAVKASRNAAASKPPVRTKFRKQKSDAPEPEEEEEVTFKSMETPLLFVDGYNIIGAWPRLKKKFQKGELDVCRELLLEDLAAIAPADYEVVCVFDDGRLAADDQPREEQYFGLVRVVYASSADSYIETSVRTLAKTETRPLIAATSDAMIRYAADAAGATVYSAKWLVAELKDLRASAKRDVQEFNARADREKARAQSSGTRGASLGRGHAMGGIRIADPEFERQIEAVLAERDRASELAMEQRATRALEKGRAKRRKQRQRGGAASPERGVGSVATEAPTSD
jgi:predicted RNA-binding protein with PIN domain